MLTSDERRKQFDIDLKFGQEGERWLTVLADEKKLEVKRERDLWAKTGNVFFEFECNGKPSGFNATSSDYWAVILSNSGHAEAVVMFDVLTLKLNLRNMLSRGEVRIVAGGDNNLSRGVLVPLSKIGQLCLPPCQKS